MNACTLALIDSGFPMYTLPISISICGVLPSSLTSTSTSTLYYVDPNKVDEKTNIKFMNVFTFLVNSKLSHTGQESSSVFEVLKGQSNLIASECKGELSSDEFIKSASIGIYNNF